MRPKETIAGRYELEGVVRTGGISVVYRGRDLEVGRTVAVKIINVHGAEEALRRRIEREMEILTALSHPHIVGCHDAGQLGEARMFLVLEWLQGEDLADFILRAPLTLRQSLEIVQQVADALATAHAQGIIHRDIKPANVYLLSPEVGAKPDSRVLDFGVAKVAESIAQLTRAGAILGTPSYMAPEQANAAKTVDGRADVYSLGVLAFELIAGKLPWTSGSDLARLARILIDDAMPLAAACPDVPKPVQDLVDAMLRRDPDARIDGASTAQKLALGCLDALADADLDHIYAPRTVASMLRAETMDVTDTSAVEDDDEDDDAADTMSLEALASTGEQPLIGTQSFDSGSEETLSVIDAQEYEAADPTFTPRPIDALDGPEPLSYVDHIPGARIFGRVDQIERLRSRSLTPLTTARPSYTLVIGPAGIGKTRVRTELSRLVRRTARPPRVFAGRAEEAMQNTPFGYVRKILFRAAQIQSNDDDRSRRDKILSIVPTPEHLSALLDVETGSEAAGPRIGMRDAGRTLFYRGDLESSRPRTGALLEDAEAERATVAAFTCEALGIAYPEIPPVIAAKGNARLLGEQLRRAVGLVLRAMSSPDGMIVIVDDVHLLDRQTAAVFADMSGPTSSVPFSLIGFSLPHFIDADERPKWPLADVEQMTAEVIELDPLENRPARELVRSVVERAIDSDALEAFVQRARGNPLYLEQLVYAAQAKGLLVLADGELRFSDTSSDGDLPQTIAASVSERILGRSNREQRLLSAAAVFGEVFWSEGVAAALDLPIDEVQLDFDRLILANLVRRRQISRYRGASEMEFTHAVIRSVALARLKRPRRREFERKVIEYLESVREHDSAVLAAHYAQSGQPDRAALRYMQAATRALELGDPESARVLIEAALSNLEGHEASELVRQALDIQEQVSIVSGDWDAGREALDRLSDLATSSQQQAHILLRRTRLARLSKRYEEAVVEADGAREAFAALGDESGLAAAELARAEASEALGDGRGALRSYLVAQSKLDTKEDANGLARVALGLARIAVASGDYRTAENRFRGSLVHAVSMRDHDLTFTTNVGLADVARLVGDVARAREYLQDAKRVAFDRERRLLLRVHEARLLAEELRHEEAFERLDGIYDLAEDVRQLGSVRRLSSLVRGQMLRSRAGSGEVRATSRRLATVEAHLERALGSAATEEPSLSVALQMALAVVLALRGDDVRAKKSSAASIAKFAQEGAVHGDEPPWLLYADARVLQLTGASASDVKKRMRRAVDHLDSIASRLERKGRQRYLERWSCQAIIVEAERAGLELERDPSSARIKTKD